MRAAVLHGREDVRVETVEVPALGPGEVLVRTRAALTCGTDVKVYRRGYHARMIAPPALFGHEMAGVVEELGPEVQGLQPGAPVVVANSAPCGECEYCRQDRANLCDDLVFWNGGYAELARIPARIVSKNLLPLPPGLEFREAALVEPLACVVRGVEQSAIRAGQTVAVVGTGPIGLMFVLLSRLAGADVIAAGRRPERLQKALEMGARAVVEAASPEELVERIRQRSPGVRGPHVVVEAVGRPETSEAAVRAVRKGGLVLLFAGCPAEARISLDAQRLHYEELTVKSSFHHTPASVRAALRMIVDRTVEAKAFITAEAPLDGLPDVLERMARGDPGLKTAIVP